MAASIGHNTVAGVVEYFKQQLAGHYSQGEAETFARLALEHYSGIPFSSYSLNLQRNIGDIPILLYQQVVDKLLQHQPIQYILGQTEFYGLQFKVTPAVLIPRPETEEIVQAIIIENQQQQGLQVVDYCTGSGCIAVTLAKHLPGAVVSAVDVSAEALEVATQNAVNNKAAVSFIKADVLHDALPFEHGTVDIIVSNPPYVPQAELSEMAANVKDYEPHLALFVPNNTPLLFYERIAALAAQQLKSGGKLYFECHINHAANVVALLKSMAFSNCRLIKDFTGRDRMVYAQKY